MIYDSRKIVEDNLVLVTPIMEDYDVDQIEKLDKDKDFIKELKELKMKSILRKLFPDEDDSPLVWVCSSCNEEVDHVEIINQKLK